MTYTEAQTNQSIYICEEVMRPYPAFDNRFSAGQDLAEYIPLSPDPEALVLGLPRGGIPVGVSLAKSLNCPLDTLIVRKLPIPSHPEMGFGAVTLGGRVHLNHEIIQRFGISQSQIDETASLVQQELARRSREYRGTDESPHVEGRSVFLVDDGLATGYTALAAIETLESFKPASIVLCVPVAPLPTVRRLGKRADQAYVLIAQSSPSFAVASFYRRFPELADKDVRKYLTSIS